MMCRLVTMIVVVLLFGFAPAPLPQTRERRDRNELSLAACQGLWEVVKKESNSTGEWRAFDWGVKKIRISGDRWTLLYPNDEEVGNYTLDVSTGRVATIDWYTLGRKGDSVPLWGGLVMRDGDLVKIMYSGGDYRGEKRQTSIAAAPPGSSLITVRKAR